MSAFIVCKEHVDYLVGAGLARRAGIGALRWLVPAPKPEGAYERGSWATEEGIEHARQQSRELTRETAGRVGCMLWAENRRSVDHRYDENGIEPECYEYEDPRVKIEPVQVLKALDCFEYQACEHPEWEESEAKAFCDALRGTTINDLPGYDVAMWEVSSVQAAELADLARVEAERAKVAAVVKERVQKMSRNEVMKAIKTALEKRSGKKWSVTGGRGTAWGWLSIDAPPSRRTWHQVPNGKKDDRGFDAYDEVNDPSKPFGNTGPEDRAELGKLLGLEKPIHCQGESVPSGSDFWAEYLDRAETGKARVFGTRDWD